MPPLFNLPHDFDKYRMPQAKVPQHMPPTCRTSSLFLALSLTITRRMQGSPRFGSAKLVASNPGAERIQCGLSGVVSPSSRAILHVRDP
jgi:hypothetical protein